MAGLVLEQAVFRGPGPGRYKLLALSPGFHEAWQSEAVRLCDGFGERPAGVSCPGCVFAQPLGKKHVAVVQVADQLNGELGFHFLVIPRVAYRDLGGDPFFLAGRVAPPWNETGPLLALDWSNELIPARAMEHVQRILQREDGPNLLGASQALVDGGRLVFVRPTPETGLLRDLWALLPTSTRAELWPASFAFGNALGFHALATPRAEGPEFSGYLTEEQAGDYPEGRYELALQFAAEAGDQRELERLFARRSRAETFRLGVMILAASVVLLFILALIKPPARKGGDVPEKANAAKDAP